MPTTLLTPVNREAGRPSGATLFRKQLLPVGKIDYKGRVINFTREYLAGLVKAFSDRAYDVVPLQFADDDNRHTDKPEQRRGTVRGLELTEAGLDVIVAAGPDAAKYLAEYPDLGVSAKIVEDYGRADGKFFPAAIKHVLGTLDPRITGMGPWQAVEAANDDGEVLDLTGEQYSAPYGNGGTLPPGITTVVNRTGQPEHVQPPPGKHRAPDPTTSPAGTAPATEEHDMALTTEQEARLGRLLDLDEDKFEALLGATEAPAEDAEGSTEDELSDEELQALIDSLPGEDGPEDEDDGDEDGEPAAEDKVPATAGAAFSSEQQAAIDLANARAEQTELELARVTSALNKAAYEKERDHLSREYGIPPRITDFARPVLEGEGHVVELANGSTVDSGAIVRRVLKEIGQTVKVLDLSGELGTPLDFSAEAEKAAEDAAVAERQDLVKEIVHSGKYGL